MNDRPSDGSPYFKVSPGSWTDLDPATLLEVVRLQGMLAAVLGPDADSRPSPLDLALKFSELSTRLFEQVAGDERDLRQIISTLRTALAVAWDMHDAVGAATTSVEQHMHQLRRTIDSFESELRDLQHAREAA